MKAKVKKFGKGGLHVVLRARDGFREGQEIEVLMNVNESKISSSLEEKKIREIAREEIERYAAEQRGM